MAAEAQSQQAPANRGPETEITLGVLDAVEQNAQVTQRTVASELGIALGLANSYLKRCVRKGLIKVKQIPPNRYLYYLTPKGFAEKSRLTAEYLGSSFTFFRRARAQIEEAMAQCRDRGPGSRSFGTWQEGAARLGNGSVFRSPAAAPPCADRPDATRARRVR